jgi:hypothetical protein
MTHNGTLYPTDLTIVLLIKQNDFLSVPIVVQTGEISAITTKSALWTY